jgi:hypothetical protein
MALALKAARGQIISENRAFFDDECVEVVVLNTYGKHRVGLSFHLNLYDRESHLLLGVYEPLACYHLSQRAASLMS